MSVDPCPETPTCHTCGKVPPKTPDLSWARWSAPRYCDEACRAAAGLAPRTLWRIDELVTELELLIGTDQPESIARRLGSTSASLERRLDRHGRSDLAYHFRPRRAA